MAWDPARFATPLIRLPRFSGGRVLAKAEHLLPSGSVYDRIALALLRQARATLEPGAPVWVAGSGSLALAFATACAIERLTLCAVVPEGTLVEHRRLLMQQGVTLEGSPAADGLRGAAERARRLASARGGVVAYAPDVPDAARRQFAATLGEELARLLPAEHPFTLVAPVGSGALLRGVGDALAQAGLDLHLLGTVAAAHPSTQDGVSLGAGLDELELVAVEDEVALQTRRELARSEGLLVGLSSAAAAQVARARAQPGRDAITLVVDAGDRYFSRDRLHDGRLGHARAGEVSPGGVGGPGDGA